MAIGSHTTAEVPGLFCQSAWLFSAKEIAS